MLDEREWAASVGMVDAIHARIGTCNPGEMDEFARALEFAQSDEDEQRRAIDAMRSAIGGAIISHHMQGLIGGEDS